MLAVPNGTVKAIIEHTIDTKSDLYKSLVANFFLTERTIPALIDVYAERLAEKKRFMDGFTHFCFDFALQSKLCLLPSVKP